MTCNPDQDLATTESVGIVTTHDEPAGTTNAPPADIAASVRELSKLRVLRGVAGVAFDWLVIGIAFVAAVTLNTPVAWVISGIIIAARQHGLLILMHDASHYRLLRNREWNDRLSNWFLAWPLLVSTEGYRNNHLAHHMHLNTELDPDWVRKNGKPEWEFPKSKLRIMWLFFRELFGGGFLEALRSITDLSGKKLQSAKTKSSRIERLCFYAVATGAITLAGFWKEVLLLWFLPAFTVLTVILRLRSIAEHFAVEGDHEMNSSRNTSATLLERFFLAPHYSGYHLDHHLYPSVPFYNLPALHATLEQLPEYAHKSHQSTTFFGRFRSSVVNELSAGPAPH